MWRSLCDWRHRKRHRHHPLPAPQPQDLQVGGSAVSHPIQVSFIHWILFSTHLVTFCTYRDFVSVVALDNRVYAIGGRSNPHHARNSSAEFYDPLTNKWIPIANMNHSRSDAGCTIYAGFYLFSSHICWFFFSKVNLWLSIDNFKHVCIFLYSTTKFINNYGAKVTQWAFYLN